MALASPWETAPGTIAVPGFSLPTKRRAGAIPAYPAGRHRGSRRSLWSSFWAAVVPTRGAHTGRHRARPAGSYRGRHTA